MIIAFTALRTVKRLVSGLFRLRAPEGQQGAVNGPPGLFIEKLLKGNNSKNNINNCGYLKRRETEELPAGMNGFRRNGMVMPIKVRERLVKCDCFIKRDCLMACLSF